MRLERNSIMDDFRIMMFYQTVLEYDVGLDLDHCRFTWDHLEGLSNCILSKDLYKENS